MMRAITPSVSLLPGFLLFFSFHLFAQNAESDLQKPVSDLDEIQRQEWEEIPTIEEVPIKNAPDEKTSKEQNLRPKREMAPLGEDDLSPR